MLVSKLAKMLPLSLSRPSTYLSTIETRYIFSYDRFNPYHGPHHKKPMSIVADAAGRADTLSGSSPSFSSATNSTPRPKLLASIFEAPGHHLEDHVERPARVQGIVHALTAAGFLPAAPSTPDAPPPSSSPLASQVITTSPQTSDAPPQSTRKKSLASKTLIVPPARSATMEEIALVHTYGEDLKKKTALATPKAPVAVADLGDPDGVTYVTETSFKDALIAVGTSLQLVDDVVNASKSPRTPTSPVDDPSNTPSAFGVIRPPGHHATSDTALGYCLLNNVAIAAKYAQKVHGLRNILVLDFDVHNGNGTCQIFWEDPTVMVIDIHEENTVYPTPEFIPSGVEDTGAGAGEGLTINIPFPRYSGPECMQMTMENVVIPAARRFRPDLILISAGYDSHVTDPFQLLQFRSSTYYSVAKQMRAVADELCNGRIVFLLEGGYDAEALGESVTETWLALVGEDSKEGAHPKELPQEEPVEEVKELIQKIKQIHKLL
jgi:acetoin utilization deacetylase AcuC-like enzyme